MEEEGGEEGRGRKKKEGRARVLGLLGEQRELAGEEEKEAKRWGRRRLLCGELQGEAVGGVGGTGGPVAEDW